MPEIPPEFWLYAGVGSLTNIADEGMEAEAVGDDDG